MNNFNYFTKLRQMGVSSKLLVINKDELFCDKVTFVGQLYKN